MPAAALVTLIATGILVVALASYLIVIAYNLRKAIDTLGLVTFGAGAIAHRVEPVEPLATQILEDLIVVDDALGELLAAYTMREVV
jgi:3-hydroxy-3-methylglutaryl CoA synthase